MFNFGATVLAQLVGATRKEYERMNMREER
jgi:hypothetical protein